MQAVFCCVLHGALQDVMPDCAIEMQMLPVPFLTI
jgi:hypothetical protein